MERTFGLRYSLTVITIAVATILVPLSAPQRVQAVSPFVLGGPFISNPYFLGFLTLLVLGGYMVSQSDFVTDDWTMTDAGQVWEWLWQRDPVTGLLTGAGSLAYPVLKNWIDNGAVLALHSTAPWLQQVGAEVVRIGTSSWYAFEYEGYPYMAQHRYQSNS